MRLQAEEGAEEEAQAEEGAAEEEEGEEEAADEEVRVPKAPRAQSSTSL